MSNLADLILNKYHDGLICGSTKRRAIANQLETIQLTYLYLTRMILPDDFYNYLGDLISDLRGIK